MSKPTLFYLSSHQGCGLRAHTSLDAAEKAGLRECGEYNFQFVRYATEEDVTHVRAMGGHVPEGRIAKATGTHP